MTTQTITLRGRTYTFTPGTDPALDGHDNRYIGELTNSRGQFAGWVFEMTNGNRLIQGVGTFSRYSAEERVALATLTIA